AGPRRQRGAGQQAVVGERGIVDKVVVENERRVDEKKAWHAHNGRSMACSRFSNEGCSVCERRPRRLSSRASNSGDGVRPKTCRITSVGSSKIGDSSRSS